MMHWEKKLDSEEIFKGKIFTVTSDTVLLENDKQALREVVHHNGGACILAMNSQGQVALVRQYRYACGQEMLEVPAGKIEIGEDPRNAAFRELQEEAGLLAHHFVEFGQLYPTVGYCTEIIYMYFASQLEPVPQCLDEDEFVSVVWMSLEEAVQKVLDGEITDSKTMIALLKADKLMRQNTLTY